MTIDRWIEALESLKRQYGGNLEVVMEHAEQPLDDYLGAFVSNFSGAFKAYLRWQPARLPRPPEAAEMALAGEVRKALDQGRI